MNPRSTLRFVRASSLLVLMLLCFLPSVHAERFGYTWSLLAFAAPSLVGLAWIRRASGRPWRDILAPVLQTCALLVPMGWILTYFLANSFYEYPNTGAVLGLTVESLSLEPDVTRPIPIEEYCFYLAGCVFVAVCHQFWIVVCDGRTRAPRPALPRRDVHALHLLSFALAGLAVALLWTLERLVPAGERYPGYLVYLALCGGPWIAVQVRRVGPRVDGAAFAYAMAMTLVLSVLWEPLLALPRGFWGYSERYCLPTYVAPGLPLEAVVVWLIVPVATVLTLTAVEAATKPEAANARR